MKSPPTELDRHLMDSFMHYLAEQDARQMALERQVTDLQAQVLDLQQQLVSLQHSLSPLNERLHLLADLLTSSSEG